MKKVGILTFHRAINYGASLQAFALMEVIQKANDLEVFQIDLDEPYITDGSKIINIRKEQLLRSLIGTIIKLPANSVRNYKFHKFWKKFLNFSESYNSEKNIEHFDYYIVGSDQVWNFDITQGDLNFLLPLDNVDRSNIKKISYAASIGKNTMTSEESKDFKKYLSDFDFISVRENSAKKLLKKIDIDSQVVLDPTLLLEKQEWMRALNLSQDRVIKEEFILVYTLEDNELIHQILENYQMKTGIKKVVFISSSMNIHKISNTYSPEEFIRIFNEAAFVITNSFHGTAFAVNFNKKFVTIEHKTRGARMVDFLKLVDLENRIIADKDHFEKMFNPIEYELVNNLLKKEREKSLKYLNDSLR